MEARLLDLIYGTIADPQQWADVLIGVSDHIGALGAMLAHVPPPSAKRPPIQILGRLPEEPSIIFRERHAWNPWTIAISKYRPGKAVSANSLLEPGSIRKTEFYADVLAPWGHADIIDINHKALSVNGGAGGFGFCLSDRSATRAEEHVRRLDPLTPHLCRALEASLLLGSHADGKRHLSVILDLMPNAALMLDGCGRITQANRAAEGLLRQSDGIAFGVNGNIQLFATHPSERQALSRALKNVLDLSADTDVAVSDPVRISRASGAPPLLLIAVPLPRPSFPFWELVAPARALIIIVDPTARSRADSSAIQAAYGLTAAEARVALLLASGVTGAQIPGLLGVTAATVKTQLRCCFEKTGAHSQAELSRLLTMFPQTGTPDDH